MFSLQCHLTSSTLKNPFIFFSVEEWIHIYVTVHVDVKHSIFFERLVQQLFVQFDGRHAFIIMIVIIMRSTKKEQNVTEINIEKFKIYGVII